jgi:hypothetical protein
MNRGRLARLGWGWGGEHDLNEAREISAAGRGQDWPLRGGGWAWRASGKKP